jgi:hypothetical protein
MHPCCAWLTWHWLGTFWFPPWDQGDILIEILHKEWRWSGGGRTGNGNFGAIHIDPGHPILMFLLTQWHFKAAIIIIVTQMSKLRPRDIWVTSIGSCCWWARNGEPQDNRLQWAGCSLQSLCHCKNWVRRTWSPAVPVERAQNFNSS